MTALYAKIYSLTKPHYFVSELILQATIHLNWICRSVVTELRNGASTDGVTVIVSLSWTTVPDRVNIWLEVKSDAIVQSSGVRIEDGYQSPESKKKPFTTKLSIPILLPLTAEFTKLVRKK